VLLQESENLSSIFSPMPSITFLINLLSPCKLAEEQKIRARGNYKDCRQLIIALLFFLVALPVFAAGNLISDRAYFEDPTNQITFIQAKQQLFAQNIGVKSF